MKQTWPLSLVQQRGLALAHLKYQEAERIIVLTSTLVLAVVLGTGHLLAFVPDDPTHWAAAGQRRAAFLLEFKQSEQAKRKPEQVQLADDGVSAFVWSLPMVVAELHRFETEILGIAPHPALTRFLEEHPS